jgi:hypothetical protein
MHHRLTADLPFPARGFLFAFLTTVLGSGRAIAMPRRRHPKTDREAAEQKLIDLIKWAERQQLPNIVADLYAISGFIASMPPESDRRSTRRPARLKP